MADTREPGNPRVVARDVGERLRARREESRITANVLAARVAMSQPKISRIETGRTAAAPEDVRRIAEALLVPPAEIEELVALAAAARGYAEHAPDLAGVSGTNLAKKQYELGGLEREAREIRVFQPALVPGLLQNDGYAEAVLGGVQRLVTSTGDDRSPGAVVNAVAIRIGRQGILTVPEKRFYFLLMESVFSNRLGRPYNQLDQIEKIRRIAAQDNVWLGVVPADAPLDAPPAAGFELLDDEWLLVDLMTTTMTYQSLTDIRVYRQYFDSVAASAITDVDDILNKYADLYHRLSARH
ncbi:helix-turn-helix domain-containing protein [Actinoplanes sp. GCM10030250]|uniref:helix-turn-helix domain-containing protein n=1 Tax=Actinoplanes sp. GCM10030250 TaxID=3273376 RepID=UPI003618FA92